MPSRPVIVGLLLFLIPSALILILKSSTSTFVTANMAVLFLVASLPIYAYSVYWAFETRRALAVRVYRGQALATGILASAVWFSGYAVIVISNSPNPQLNLGVPVIALSLLLLSIFYFTDVTMKAARRSDPLLRDTLHWSKIRIPLWAVVLLSLGVIMAVVGYAAITNNTDVLNGINDGTYGNAFFNFDFEYLINLPFIGVLLIAAAAYRAKWDATLRRHFLWLAVALALYFILFNFNIPGTFAILFLGVGLALFMAARSLVPVGRIQKISG
jgi:hypothetical protein